MACFFSSSGSLWNLLFLPGILKFHDLPWCRSVFINFSGCVVDSFSLGDLRVLDLESFLTFFLIVSSLPVLYFCFLNSFYSDIGSLRFWKSFSFWENSSTFSSSKFLFVKVESSMMNSYIPIIHLRNCQLRVSLRAYSAI